MAAPEEFTQGDEPTYDVTVYTDRNETAVQDITGATVVGKLGLVSVPTTFIEVAGSVQDGPNGLARVTFPAAQTAAAVLPAGEYDMTIRVTLGGVPSTVLRKRVHVLAELPAEA